MFRTIGIMLSAASLAALVACSGDTPATNTNNTTSDESPAEQGATTDQKPVEQPAQ
ncbi:hypothetical protein [Paenibacillus wulumuqiensis]|uniref:hypothetical protein n=1 Tax=Paenibacillus wulumuqiensis TaxID=1567107 RepID=UPI0012DDD0F7|nr:hypothetical protein [Paenibacillus wulumuqiensis]